jgi:propanediol dehydratase large subunit
MIIEAILKINPNAQVSVNADDINQITWHNGTTPIPVADIQAQLPIVEFDMAIEFLRAKRNKDLQDSDWTQLPDTTLTTAEKTAWMNYRTELRNITNGLTTIEDVKAVAFPTKPA